MVLTFKIYLSTVRPPLKCFIFSKYLHLIQVFLFPITCSVKENMKRIRRQATHLSFKNVFKNIYLIYDYYLEIQK